MGQGIQIASCLGHAGDSMSTRQYCLIVEGELGARYASAFEGMAVSAHDGITELRGAVIDPSHLQGLLERITGLGLILSSVTSLDTGNVEQPGR